MGKSTPREWQRTELTRVRSDNREMAERRSESDIVRVSPSARLLAKIQAIEKRGPSVCRPVFLCSERRCRHRVSSLLKTTPTTTKTHERVVVRPDGAQRQQETPRAPPFPVSVTAARRANTS